LVGFRRTQTIPELGGFYKNVGNLLGSFGRGSYFGDCEVPLLVPLSN